MRKHRLPNPEVLEREARVVELRIAGRSWYEIGQTVGLSPTGAHQAYKRALDRIPSEQVAELRKIDNERIDALLGAAWEPALKGSARHIEVIVKLLERRARLMGLDAPMLQRIEVLTEDVVDAAIAEIERQIAELDNGPGRRQLPSGAWGEDEEEG